ncbi:lyase family protein [Roseobacter sp. CCS2]|uniref:lyase family protein n=1 Tax=Roseobacter sp. CCS2 TaxID=391593 RepID=UPI0000F404A4|nr:lyase family protein [Roseobacter sp. CCS2]EBA14032.1 3-carboxy-cis,cis-muconate cycloisomerase [Roseobacter sp. CCS2]
MINIATHPWISGLLGDEEMASIFEPEAELKRLLRIEAAWMRALGEIDGIDASDHIAASIEAAQIDPQALKAGMTEDGVPIPILVRLLRKHLRPDQATHVHQGLTSQDVVDTSLILALVQVLSLLKERLGLLDQHLAEKQRAFGNRSITAFTRMQPAMETTVHEVIDRWRQPFAELIEDLSDLQNKVGVLQWGGPIGARAHVQADALGASFAQHLGLKDPGRDWHTDRTVIVKVTQLLCRIATVTGKIGDDIVLFAITGSDHITFEGGQSSAMPHKNNPVKAEALVALADFAAGLAATALRSARHEGFRSGRAWMLEWLTLPQLCVTAGAGVRLAKHTLHDITSIGLE